MGHFWTLRTLASQDIRNSIAASGALGGGSGVRSGSGTKLGFSLSSARF